MVNVKCTVFKSKSIYTSQYLDTSINDLNHHSAKQGAELSKDNNTISRPKEGMAFFFFVIFFFAVLLTVWDMKISKLKINTI